MTFVVYLIVKKVSLKNRIALVRLVTRKAFVLKDQIVLA